VKIPNTGNFNVSVRPGTYVVAMSYDTDPVRVACESMQVRVHSGKATAVTESCTIE
jgi:hypothetical protein